MNCFWDKQLDFLIYLASWRNEWLDPFFLFLQYCDSSYFLMVLLPFIWLGFSYRWGIRLAFLLMVNALLNFYLKLVFDLPRPITSCPDLPLLPFDTPGFPSGAAQSAMILSALLIYEWESWASWALGILFLLLVSFSRLYLGVHYPVDIVGGWFFGFFLFFAYVLVKERIESFLTKEKLGLSLVLSCVIPFAWVYFFPSSMVYKIMGAWLGFGVGAYFGLRYRFYQPPSKHVSTRIIKGLFAVLSVFLLFFIIHRQASLFMNSLVLSLWISLGASPCIQTLFSHRTKRKKTV